MAGSSSKSFGWQSGEPPQVPDHELLCRIGGGSYGEVWLARSALGALRAVKVVHRERFDNDRPYEREFEGLLHFEPVSRGHEGLVDILQVGRADRCFYCVMELADAVEPISEARPQQDPRAQLEVWKAGNGTPGQPEVLGEILELTAPQYVPLTLDTLARQKGRLPVRDCVRIALTLARALEYLHGRKLVHRDIKPSNIIFVEGVPKLADVSLVAKAETGRSFVGTEGFVPPEGPGTNQADIYSLGKVIYEIAMGKDRLAFPSPPTLVDSPESEELLDLNEVILKACHPDVKQRYASAGEMAKDLQLLASGHSLRRARQHRRRKRHAMVLASLCLIGIFLAGAAAWFWAVDHPSLVEDGSFQLANATSAYGSQLARFSGGQERELVTVGGGRALVTDLYGQKLWEKDLPAEYPNAWLRLCARTEDDDREQPILSSQDSTNRYLIAMSSALQVSRVYTNFARLKTNAIGLTYDCGSFQAFGCLSNRFNSSVLVTAFSTCGSKSFLGLYSFTNSSVVSTLPITSLNGIPPVITDADGDGIADLIFGTYAPDNGFTNECGMQDSFSYVVGYSWSGKKLWPPVKVGGKYSEATPLLLQEGGLTSVVARQSLIAVRAALPSAGRPAEGALLKIEIATGQPTANTYSHTNDLTSHVVASLSNGQAPIVLATDSGGWLHRFDTQLRHTGMARVIPAHRNSWSDLELIGVTDLDGDGRREIVLHGAQVAAHRVTNMGGKLESSDRKTFLNCILYVVDENLRLLAESLITERVEQVKNYSVLLAPRASGKTEILVLDEKVRRLHFSRKWQLSAATISK